MLRMVTDSGLPVQSRATISKLGAGGAVGGDVGVGVGVGVDIRVGVGVGGIGEARGSPTSPQVSRIAVRAWASAKVTVRPQVILMFAQSVA